MNSNQIIHDSEVLEEVASFMCLSSIIGKQVGSDSNVKAWVGKVRAAFLQLVNICNSKQIPGNIKVGVFNINIKTFLLFEAKT